jgi:hypothetical protein
VTADDGFTWICVTCPPEMVTSAEREEFCTVLEALNMSREHLDMLLLRG